MSRALAALQGWLQPAPLALALLLGAAKPCSAWAPATLAKVQPHTVPAQHCLPWALLTSLFKTDMTWTRLPGCCPSSGRSGCRGSPGVSSVLGAGVRSTSPTGRVGELCHTPAALSILSLSADVPVGAQSCWIGLGEGVTGFVGGQGLFTVKTYNLLCPLKPNPKHCVHVDG